MMVGHRASGRLPKAAIMRVYRRNRQHDHNDDDDQENDSAAYVHVRPPLSAIAPDFRTPRGWTQILAGCHAMQCPSEQSSVRVVVRVRPGYHEPIAAQNTRDRPRPTTPTIT